MCAKYVPIEVKFAKMYKGYLQLMLSCDLGWIKVTKTFFAVLDLSYDISIPSKFSLDYSRHIDIRTLSPIDLVNWVKVSKTKQFIDKFNHV